MPIPPAQLQAEFTAYLDRTGFDTREQRWHQVWVALGMVGCLVVLWQQFAFGLDAPRPPFYLRSLVLAVSMANLTAATLLIAWSQEAQLRHLRQTSGSVERRAERVAVYVRQRDTLLLLVAGLGQAVAWFAGQLGVHLLSWDAPLVLVNLLPTAQQVWFGFVEVPTRKRLIFLYKLVALHEARATRAKERAQGH